MRTVLAAGPIAAMEEGAYIGIAGGFMLGAVAVLSHSRDEKAGAKHLQG